MSVILAEVTRGQLVESIHRGDIAVVHSSGKILYHAGDVERLTYMRSSSKPIQAVAVLECGVAEKFNLDLKEIAVLLSSHSGEKEHVEVLAGIAEKLGIAEEVLRCGTHIPLGKNAARELAAAGKDPTSFHCTCSGKHLGHIAAALAKGLSPDGYYKKDYEVQLIIKETIARFSRIGKDDIILGLDGCGVPVYGLPLKNMALAYANLCNESFMDGQYNKSQNYVTSAMTMHPEMVAGGDRLDTVLMKRLGDRILCKFGDEGVYCTGIIGKGVGIALKIEDGSDRAVGAVIIETLLQMGIIKREEAEELHFYWNPKILNNRKEQVGEIRPVFRLEQSL